MKWAIFYRLMADGRTTVHRTLPIWPFYITSKIKNHVVVNRQLKKTWKVHQTGAAPHQLS
jgi:hypothetical protein